MRYTVEVKEEGTFWFKEGTQILHRLDGPAMEWADGTKEWWVEGRLHRLDGPAIESASGYKQWWVKGKLHRLDGPAMEWVNGAKEWWVEGRHLTEEEFLKLTQPTKKMTIKEIQDILGYKLEIVE